MLPSVKRPYEHINLQVDKPGSHSLNPVQVWYPVAAAIVAAACLSNRRAQTRYSGAIMPSSRIRTGDIGGQAELDLLFAASTPVPKHSSM